ncbi:MAG: hypothetical protein H6Q02_2249 [Acidobacteria bacterium]|jgi:rod shape-determining protein MreD|nr:hypothetical protein [Acidobacteriota bacterium]
MRLLVVLVVAILLQLALPAVRVWAPLAACRPLLLVTVAAARTLSPVGTAWVGLGVGLLIDLLTDRPIGPGGIGGALAGVVVSLTARRFELTGPLFWIVGSVLAVAATEATSALVLLSLGGVNDHGWRGSVATLATTGALALLVATGERAWLAWQSPTRRRRRMLKRL